MVRRVVPLLVLAIAGAPLAAQTQPPAVTFDPYRSNIEISLRDFTDPVIQAELKLTDEQKAKLAKIPDDLLAKNKEPIEKEKAAQKEIDEKQAAFQVETQKKLDALIEKNLTADQRKRLAQMVTQALGVNAFYDAEVSKALSLPKDFPTKLADIRSEGLTKLGKEFPGATFPPSMDPETRRRYTAAQRKMNQDTVTKFVGTFTDEQKKVWKEQAGEPSEAVIAMGNGRPFSISLSSRASAQAGLLVSAKALDELKVEKAAREAIADGWQAILTAAQAGGWSAGRSRGGFANDILINLGPEADAKAAEVLTPAQAKRLAQIQFQMRGTGVFTSSFAPNFGNTLRGIPTNPLTRLTLTPAQVTKIDAVLADATKQRRELGGGRDLGAGFGGGRETEEQTKARQAATVKAFEIDQKALADILATFDAGQKAVWKELAGEPLDLSKTKPLPPYLGSGFGGLNGSSRSPSVVSLWMREGATRELYGEYAAALSAYDEAIRLAPSNPLHQKNKAWLLATCPSEWVRDGKQAVEIIKKVMEQTKEPTYGDQHILAAALAEAGQFDEAVKAQEKAITLLPKEGAEGGFNPTRQLKPQYEERLKLFQEKKPYRMEPRQWWATPPGGPGGR